MDRWGSPAPNGLKQFASRIIRLSKTCPGCASFDPCCGPAWSPYVLHGKAEVALYVLVSRKNNHAV